MTNRSSMLAIIFIGQPQALQILTSMPAQPDLGGPIENTLQPLSGAAFPTTHSFALARCLIQPFSSIGLFISSGFLYLDTT